MGNQQTLEIAHALANALNLLQHCNIQMKDAVAVGKALDLISACITVLNQPQPQDPNPKENEKEEVK